GVGLEARAAVELHGGIDSAVEQGASAGGLGLVVVEPLVGQGLEFLEILVGQGEGLGAHAVLVSVPGGRCFSERRAGSGTGASVASVDLGPLFVGQSHDGGVSLVSVRR